MTQSLDLPDRRAGFDTGSVAELVDDCLELHLPAFAPLHWVPQHVDIVVPDDAAALLVGLGDYGS